MNTTMSDKDFATLIREKSKAGDPNFQYQVGLCYRNGYNIEKNNDEALKWYLLAANQEHSDSQFSIGYMYYFGLGVEKDYKEAVKWYERAAKNGDAIAQNNLALCYENGEGVSKDITEAERLYNLSAEQGYWRASRNLGVLYSYGKTVEQDLSKAKMYFEKALANIDFPDDKASEEDKKDIQEQIEIANKKLAEAEQKAKTAREAARTEIFVSYSHKDTEFKEDLCSHLKILEHTANITWWDDRKIQGGEKWDTEIKEALSKAKVAVLLVSANFFASDYIWKTELPKAFESGATILWLPVSSCAFELTELADYQAMTDPQKPLTKCDRAERDDVYADIVRRINGIYKV